MYSRVLILETARKAYRDLSKARINHDYYRAQSLWLLPAEIGIDRSLGECRQDLLITPISRYLINHNGGGVLKMLQIIDTSFLKTGMTRVGTRGSVMLYFNIRIKND